MEYVAGGGIPRGEDAVSAFVGRVKELAFLEECYRRSASCSIPSAQCDNQSPFFYEEEADRRCEVAMV